MAEDHYEFGPGMDMVTRLLNFGPVSDGYELPLGEDFMDAFSKSKVKIPLMIGSNLNETNLFQCVDLKGKMTLTLTLTLTLIGPQR